MGRTPALDPNSAYAYLLLCTDFADTSAVALCGGRMAGFVLGYRPPSRPDVYFVWQIAVCEEARGRGIGHSLIRHVLGRVVPEGVAFLEATVTPSNRASWALFRGFARASSLECDESLAFPSHLFPNEGHEDEVRIRIGPVAMTSPRASQL